MSIVSVAQGATTADTKAKKVIESLLSTAQPGRLILSGIAVWDGPLLQDHVLRDDSRCRRRTGPAGQ